MASCVCSCSIAYSSPSVCTAQLTELTPRSRESRATREILTAKFLLLACCYQEVLVD